MRRADALAWSACVASVVFAMAGLILLALSWSVEVPPGWGFRGFPAILAVAFASVGVLIATRQRANPIGWLFLFAALLEGIQVLAEEYAFYALLQRHAEIPGGEVGAWVQGWIWLVPSSAIAPVMLLFPTGRTRSRRWMLVALATVPIVAFNVAVFALAPGTVSGLAAFVDNPFGLPVPEGWFAIPTTLGFIGLVSLMGASFLSIARRFQDARGVERQQLKWFAYASGVLAFALFLNTAANAWLVLFVRSGSRGFVELGEPTFKATQLLLIAGITFLPVAVGIAIVRYRLYDIDLLINRTLVYGATSATLVLTYALAVLALGAALRPFTEQSELAVAGSTLAVAALVQPVRRRVQSAVDRRFYRSRYDAERTVDRFAARLRDELDLDALRGELVGVVRETVRPAHASLWLRERA